MRGWRAEEGAPSSAAGAGGSRTYAKAGKARAETQAAASFGVSVAVEARREQARHLDKEKFREAMLGARPSFMPRRPRRRAARISAR